MNLDIILVTHNRKVYLERCVWSIIASTQVEYNLTVIDDFSKDGTKEFLEDLQSRGLINYIRNEKNLGTTKSLNKAINQTKASWFVVIQDDMYLYRGWDKACLDIIDNFEDCGIVSFYDWARLLRDNEPTEKINKTTLKAQRSGMACSFILRDLYTTTGGFKLRPGDKMGYFSTPFCRRVRECSHPRNQHYFPIPLYAHHMDDPDSKLCEESSLKEYSKMRSIEKKHFGL